MQGMHLRPEKYARKAPIGAIAISCAVAAIAQSAAGGVSASGPRLTPMQAKQIALRASRPYLDASSPSKGLPLTVVSVRLAHRGQTLIWAVRTRAHYFLFPCEQSSAACVPSPAEFVAVHIRDATARAYSVKPLSG